MNDGCLDTPSGPPGASGGLRCRDGLAPRQVVSCGAIGLRTRMTRLCAGDDCPPSPPTSGLRKMKRQILRRTVIKPAHRRIPAFLACDVTHSTPLPRPLVRRDPVHPLAAPFQGAGLFCCFTAADVSRSIRVIARHQRKGGANGGAGGSDRDGARSPDSTYAKATVDKPGAGAMQGRRRRAHGREAACPPARFLSTFLHS
jgi:hypothetical protein